MCGAIAQVEFRDSSGSLDLSAVQVDQGSNYTAEDTSFKGFEGEVGFVHNTYFAGSVGDVQCFWDPSKASAKRTSTIMPPIYYS